MRAGQGFIVCYAANDGNTFNEAKTLYQAILRAKEPHDKIAFAIVATKIVIFFELFYLFITFKFKLICKFQEFIVNFYYFILTKNHHHQKKERKKKNSNKQINKI